MIESALSAAIDAEAPSLRLKGHLQGRTSLADLVLLVDVWMLLALLWGVRFLTLRLDPAAVLYSLVFFALVSGPYANRQRLTYSAADDLAPTAKHAVVAYAASVAVITLTGEGHGRIVLTVAASSVPVLLLGRALAYAVVNAARVRTPSRAIVIGAGSTARKVIQSLKAHREYGLLVVGVVDDEPLFDGEKLGAPILGSIAETEDLMEKQEIDSVIVAFARGGEEARVRTIRQARERGASVWIVPRMFDIPSGVTCDHIWGVPVVPLSRNVPRRPGWILKRATDSMLAALGLIVLSPVLIVLGVAVLVDSGRPVFIRQERVGRDGRPFSMYKFRSMKLAEATVEQTEWNADEARITRVGGFLREWGLDELPQLWNVFRGEMSLVGPRPERPFFVSKFSESHPDYTLRHRVPTGITGLAQVSGLRGDTPIEERYAFDNYYIERWSMSEDFKILMKTALSFKSGRGRDEQ